jgi:predicted nuclease of predicted toxin-antitoxin system
MKIIIDMNLSPDWVEVFEKQGWQAQHWSRVGNPQAPDQEIMEWARVNGWIVFTHDLDFGALLALTRVQSPSVIQVRTQDIMPAHLADRLNRLLRDQQSALEKGALIIDEIKSRIRILPF